MALKTDYKDDVFDGNRKYTRISNQDGTFSYVDVTEYTIEGDTFSATDVNAMNTEINKIPSIIKEITLSASSWSSGLYTITDSLIVVDGAYESTQEILPARSITQEQLTALQAANIQDYSQSNGSVVIKAFGAVPTIDIPIRIIFRGCK